MSFRSALIASVALIAGATSSFAADLPQTKIAYPPVVEWNPWMVRVRALAVVPQESAKLNLNGVRIGGEDVDISTSIVPELDISDFFTKNIAVELILGTTPHKVKGSGTIAGLGDIGRAWLLPPTLTLQYHFDISPNFKPYVGAGVNYTFFYNEKAKGVFDTFDIKNEFGWALQVGADFMINEHWGLNVDVKKIFLKPDVRATIGPDVVTGEVKIDPWLIGAGVTYKF